jgi:hypothetical protein
MGDNLVWNGLSMVCKVLCSSFVALEENSVFIPTTGSPTSFNITAADININAGGVLGSVVLLVTAI